MSFTYLRTIRFQDTDAAGVVYFAQGLAICHEAYEASLAEAGIEVQSFFHAGASIVPITHAEIDFYHPMRCGDRITVRLTARAIQESPQESTYTVEYQIYAGDRPDLQPDLQPDRSLAKAMTRHVCLQTQSGQKVPISSDIRQWLGQFL